MNLSLTDKRAFVCGSTQGIGKAIAIELAKLGAQLTLIARNEKALKVACKELKSAYNQRHDYLVADFTQPNSLKERIDDYMSDGRTIHILINNTGGPPGGPILEAKPDEFLRAYQMHLVCNHLLTQAVTPGMKKANYGRIIQIISTSVREPIPGLGVSNTTRGAVASWAKTLSREVAPFGITVNNLLPGFITTQRLASLLQANAEKKGVSVEEEEAVWKGRVPAGRFGTAAEIAQVAFLACSLRQWRYSRGWRSLK